MMTSMGPAVLVLLSFCVTYGRGDEIDSPEYMDESEDHYDYKRRLTGDSEDVYSGRKGYRPNYSRTCKHNGRRYNIGDVIPTPEKPCFQCVCSDGWTGPSISHCDEMECPRNINEGGRCVFKYTEGKCCPDVDCPPTTTEPEEETCEYNGVIYALGEPIPTPDKPCYKCACREGWKGPSGTHCAIVDCPPPSLYRPRGCTPKYISGQCCAKWECPTAPIKEDTCQYNGVTYKLGEQIPTPDKPCLKCTCSKGWTFPKDSHCTQEICPSKDVRQSLKMRCTQKYVRGSCCPEWDCTQRQTKGGYYG